MMKESGKKNAYFIVILIGLILIMYLWKGIAVKNVQRQMEAKQVETIEKAQQIVTEKTRYLLRLTTTTFVWAIRKEMLRENYEQINEYLNQLVKEPRIKQILVVKSDGVVAVSTDKKLEGVAFSSLYPSELMQKDEIEFVDDQNGNILILSPIMGLNKKLGTLLMVYEAERMNVDATQ